MTELTNYDIFLLILGFIAVFAAGFNLGVFFEHFKKK